MNKAMSNTHIINTKESRAIVGEIANALKSGLVVKVTGLGVFLVKNTKPRLGVNPKTQVRIEIPAGKKVAVRISGLLKSEVL